MMISAQAGRKSPNTRSRIATPPIAISALSPPPMRRARPPARTRPSVAGCGEEAKSGMMLKRRVATFSVVMNRRLAPVFRAFLFHIGEVLVEHDPVLACQRHEAL